MAEPDTTKREEDGGDGGDDAPPENVEIDVVPLVKLVKVLVPTGEELEEELFTW